MEPDFDLNQPIYLQIIQRICSQILRGDYRPGDKLPSLSMPVCSSTSTTIPSPGCTLKWRARVRRIQAW